MWSEVVGAVCGRGVSLSRFVEWLELTRSGEEVVVETGRAVADARDVGTFWRVCDVARYVRAMCGVLARSFEIERGERVVVCTSNGIEMMWVSLAVMRLGAVVVPVNHQCSADEIGFIVEDTGARVVLLDDIVWGRLKDVRCKVGLLAGGSGLSPSAEEAVVAGKATACMLEEGEEMGAESHALGVDEVCAIFYTSGTTGVPKGAMLTSRSILGPSSALFVLPVQWLGRSMFAALPLAHIMGFIAVLLGVISGVRVVFRERFDPVASQDVIEARRVRSVLGVPSMYRMWLAHGAQKRDWSSVEVFASAADVMPGELIDTFKNMGSLRSIGLPMVPATFVELYGSVELSGAAMIRVSVPFVRAAEGGFVGWPLPGFHVRVLDEEGRRLPRGERGELFVRGAGVLRGYLGWEGRDGGDVVDTEGWLRTGDLASKTPWGFVRFAGREKHVIKSGGFSIFPAEIEAKIQTMEGVQLGVVLGLEDELKGARVVAAIVLEEGCVRSAEDVHGELKTRVAWYKAPREVVLMGADEIPYGPTGKVLKGVLKERVEGILGGKEK